jgi:UPF0271 protein
MYVVDLNADVGEWELDGSSDAALMPFISSVNVACGVHAGNDEVMAATVDLAARHGLTVGAHPSLNDREGFGRVERPVSSAAVESLITDQVSALAQIAARHSVRLRHVKPHGALYNMAARDRRVADAIAAAVARIDASLAVIGLAGSELIAAARHAGLAAASEGFADRGYRDDGSLVPRSAAGAVVTDPAVVASRAVMMVTERRVVAINGTSLPLQVETICVHGDTPGAPVLARGLRMALEAAGVRVSARR